jgi:hypothetical protein
MPSTAMLENKTMTSAMDLPMSYGLGADEQIILPVDPVAIVRCLGIDSYDAKLPNGIPGALVKKPESDAVILMNAGHAPVRRRFTMRVRDWGQFESRLLPCGQRPQMAGLAPR